MHVKLFELRDSGTFIPVLCTQLGSEAEEDRYLLARAGYGQHQHEQRRYIIMTLINGGATKSTSDPYDWGGSRTYGIAHQYIRKHWEDLKSGDVIDVQYILGETSSPKLSEREEYSHGF